MQFILKFLNEKKLKFTRFPYDLKKKNYISYPLIIKGYFLNADLKRLLYFFIFFVRLKCTFIIKLENLFISEISLKNLNTMSCL